MKKRHLHIIKHRLKNLPSGIDFFRYSFNVGSSVINGRLKTTSVSKPTSVMVELTNHCQLRCITCAREYELGFDMDKGNMPFDNFKRLFDELYPFIDRIGLTGLGEPLIYPELDKALDYINSKGKGTAVFISTNAQLPDTVKIISSIKDKIDTLQISIDGLGKTFEKVRRNAEFSSFCDNVGNIVNLSLGSRFIPKLNMVVFSENFRQMQEVLKFAVDTGVKEVFFNSINIVANNLSPEEYKLYSTQEFRSELKKASDFAHENGIELDIPKFSAEKGFRTCPYMRNHFYITWDGFVVPCCAKPFPKEQNFGNVFEKKLQSCLNSDDFKSFRTLSNKNITPDFCGRCHYII